MLKIFHTYKYNVSMTKKTMFYLFSTYPTYGDRGFEGCLGSWAQANIDCGSIFVGGMETRARRPVQDYTHAAHMLSEGVWAQLQPTSCTPWTPWACWSLRCISWKPLSGSLGLCRALTGRKKTECPELWENCGKLWEDFGEVDCGKDHANYL